MGKCVIVTGGSSGIGKAVAQSMAEQGCNIVIGDMDQKKGRKVAQSLGGHFVPVDLTKAESCRTLVDETIKKYNRVDILVNNAGFQHVCPLEDFPEEKWNQMIGVLLTAPFLLTKYVWPYMKREGWGRVVNIGSIHSKVASVHKVAYNSAKHGLLGLTKTAALEGGGVGITVNAICPSYVRTPLVENQIKAQALNHGIPEEQVIEEIMLKPAAVKKMIEPAEIAALVSFLCSDNGAAVTGAAWSIDCGWTAQ